MAAQQAHLSFPALSLIFWFMFFNFCQLSGAGGVGVFVSSAPLSGSLIILHVFGAGIRVDVLAGALDGDPALYYALLHAQFSHPLLLFSPPPTAASSIYLLIFIV